MLTLTGYRLIFGRAYYRKDFRNLGGYFWEGLFYFIFFFLGGRGLRCVF